jgi:putative DNA primase/helicase
MLIAEDDAGDTVVPRLKVANADLSRVQFVDVPGHDFDLSADMQTLEQKIRHFRDVRLIIIDPITAFSKSGNVRRAAAGRLQQLAAALGAAVVVISHLSKTTRTGALTRVMGSLDLVAVARAAFVVVQEQGTDRCLFLPAKNSLAALRDGLAYRVEPKIASDGTEGSVVVWDSAPVTVSADEALAPTSNRTSQQPALIDAANLLELLLISGPLAAKDVFCEARDAGVSVASLRRAAQILRVKKRRVGGVAGGGHWIWELPDSSGRDEGEPRALAEVLFGAE